MAGAFVYGAAADMVPVFGQIGQMAEVSESPNHAHGLLSAEAFEQFFQGLVGFMVGVAPKSHRKFAYVFDQFKGRCTFLFADHVTQNSAE